MKQPINKYLKSLLKGLRILFRNYSSIVDDIEKQEKELQKLQTTESRADVYNHLQKLVKLHVEVFSVTWTNVLALLALVISIIALFK